MVASLHRIEAHLLGTCPDPDLEPITTRPLRELLRIRRPANQRPEAVLSALTQALKGK